MIRRLRLKFIAIVLAVVFAIILIFGTVVNITVYYGTYRKYDNALDDFYEYIAEDLFQFNDIGAIFGFHNDTGFFIIRKPSNSDFLDYDLNNVIGMEYEDVLYMSEYVLNAETSHGLIDTYRYGIYTDASGNETILFHNVAVNISFLNELHSTTTLVSVIIFLITAILTIPISARVVSAIDAQLNSQNEFITNASHDLKTPIAVISANMDVLSLNDKDNQWIESTKKQVKYLKKLINHIITTSKLNEKGFSTPFEDFNLSHAVQDISDQFDNLTALKNVIYTQDIETGITYYGSEIYIRQLLNILCENAVNYANENGRIAVSLRKQKNNIHFTIFNTHDPNERIEIDKLFNRFYRGDSSRSSDKHGNGLGLSMAKSITEMHGGTITAQCKTDDSITFTVILKG